MRVLWGIVFGVLLLGFVCETASPTKSFKTRTWLPAMVIMLLGLTAAQAVAPVLAKTEPKPQPKKTVKTVTTIASWYSNPFGVGHCAARLWPRGSRLAVRCGNMTRHVKVNDYGPDPKKHPDRGIDLDRRDFAAFSHPDSGLTTVTITPTYIPPSRAPHQKKKTVKPR